MSGGKNFDESDFDRRSDQDADGASCNEGHDDQAGLELGSVLDWMSWCFLMGEMSADDQSAFQQRMEHEPEVAKALARAIELHAVCETGFELSREVAFSGNGSASGATDQSGSVESVARLRRSWLGVLSLTAAALILISIGLYWTGEQARQWHDEEMLASVWASQMTIDGEADEMAMRLAELNVDLEDVSLKDEDQQSWVFSAAMALEAGDLDDDEEWVF
jgi:hypothetical protein